MHVFALTETPALAHETADIADMMCDAGEQEEQITRNILASWQVQRSMHSEVKKVLEVAKRKKRNERVVRLVDAAARGDVAEVTLAANVALSPASTWSPSACNTAFHNCLSYIMAASAEGFNW